MTEPDDVEEDLFADLYDGDEPTSSSNNHNIPTAAPAAAPESSTTRVKDEPGYGEEPEVPYDPTSFDVDTTAHDDPMNGQQSLKTETDNHAKPAQTESFGINMKEDGWKDALERCKGKAIQFIRKSADAQRKDRSMLSEQQHLASAQYSAMSSAIYKDKALRRRSVNG